MSVAPGEGQVTLTLRDNTPVGVHVQLVRILMYGTISLELEQRNPSYFPELSTINVQHPPFTAWGSLLAHHQPSHGLWGLQHLH